MTYQTIDPSTGELKGQWPVSSKAEIESALQNTQTAFSNFKTASLGERASWLIKTAEDLEQNAPRYAKIIQLEMGKPFEQGVAEVQKSALVCRFYAEQSIPLLGDDPRPTEATQSYVRKDPLGPIFAIMPWNFPFWQSFRVIAPNLMVGNPILLKPAMNTPQCGLELEKILERAGLIPGAFQTLLLSHTDAEALIADPRIRGVTLTGSETAGRRIGALAGENLKPCVLELGGADPFIVFEDADLVPTAQTAAAARCQNTGQSCIAAKRFIVHQSIAQAFAEEMATAMQSAPLGPLANEKQRQALHDQVSDALNKGALLHCGGRMPEGPGSFYPATLISHVTPEMRVYHEETFGPLASLFVFKTDDEALALANGTSFGLGSSLWTKDPKRIERFTRDLECGTVRVNSMMQSDPRLPFGGVKASGYGKELGAEGLFSFVNLKTVWIK